MIKIYKNYKTEEILSRKIDDYGEYEEVDKGHHCRRGEVRQTRR